jgi:NDP-sugar pyrophosphorylase family protein
MLPVLILAGGLATRMRPITEKIPKALIEIMGRPFITYQLDYLYEQGVRDVVLCLGYLGEMIESLVGDGSKIGINIRYSYDGAKLLGTGGAIKKALPLLPEEFFVFYGDSYLPINFNDVFHAFKSSNKNASMVVIKNENKWDISNVIYEQGVLVEYNKKNPSPAMQYIDYGLGILSKSNLINYPTDQAFDLADLYHDLSINNKLAGYEVFERFYEIGSVSGLQQTKNYFLSLGKENL